MKNIEVTKLKHELKSLITGIKDIHRFDEILKVLEAHSFSKGYDQCRENVLDVIK